jgi:hypothetical protein
MFRVLIVAVSSTYQGGGVSTEIVEFGTKLAADAAIESVLTATKDDRQLHGMLCMRAVPLYG